MGALISALVAGIASVAPAAPAVSRSPSGPTAVAVGSCPAYTAGECRRIASRPVKPTDMYAPTRRSASGPRRASMARLRACRAFRLRGTKFSVTVVRGRVRCDKARRVLRDFLSGRGQKHGPGGGPVSENTWTVDGWKCGYGTGGGGCIHRGRTYRTARAWIAAQQTF